MPDTLYVLVGLAFMLAGTVKGVLGMGLPTVALGLLGLMVSPTQAASLVVLPALLTNFWQFFGGPDCSATLKRLAPMMLTMVLGVWFGVKLMIGAHQALVGLALGVLLVIYAVFGLNTTVPVLANRHEKYVGPLAGISTGVLSGATGVMVMPGLAYLQALGLERKMMIQALGLMFSVGTLSLGALLWINADHWDSLAAPDWTGLSVAGTVAALAGMRFGRLIEPRLSGPVFKRLFAGWLMINGTVIIVRNAILIL